MHGSRDARCGVRETRGERYGVKVALLILLLCAAPAAAQPVAMSPEAFVAELDRLRTELGSGPPGQVPNPRVPTVWVIETGGERFETPSSWLRAELETARRDPARWPAQRGAMLARLDALQAEVQALAASSSAPSGVDREGGRAALADVLAGAEFRRLHRQNVLSRLGQRISQLWRRVWERFGAGRIAPRGTAIVFAWVAVFFALALLSAWLARFILRPGRNRRVAAPASPPPVRSARAWAHDALSATDPREAARCAYRAAVRGLEEEGTWRADPTRTPREYLRLLTPDHRRRALLADVARRFEEIWFGARPATEDDRRAVLLRLRELGCLPAE